MGYTGASRKTPNDTLWEMLSLRLSRPISAPLLTAIQGTCGYLHHSWQLSRAPAGTCTTPDSYPGHLRYLHHSWQLSRAPAGTCTTPDSCSVKEIHWKGRMRKNLPLPGANSIPLTLAKSRMDMREVTGRSLNLASATKCAEDGAVFLNAGILIFNLKTEWMSILDTEWYTDRMVFVWIQVKQQPAVCSWPKSLASC